MATATATAARKARIKARLAAAEEPQGAVEAATVAHTEPVAEPEPEPTVEQAPAVRGPRRRIGRIGGPTRIEQAATSQRSNKPPNYKLHVLTALALAVVIRVSRYGTKAVTG